MTQDQSIAYWQQQCERLLTAATIEAPRQTSWELLQFCTGLSKASLMTSSEKQLSSIQIKKLQKVVKLRCKHVPLQYILGNEDFWGMTLDVGKGVLIPRPETELLLQAVKKRFLPPTQAVKLVDLCTGSGNIALALASEYPDAAVMAVDKSRKALTWARHNQKRTGNKNVRFILGDLSTAIPLAQNGKIALVTSNPPYITTQQMLSLQAEVLQEPKMALHGGQDGLRDIRKVIQTAKRLLCPGGLCVCEIGIGQYKAVIDLFKTHGFSKIQQLNDWQKIPRIISARFNQ